MSSDRLAIPSPCRRYGHGDLAKLEQRLRDNEETQPVEIAAPEDVLLNQRALIQKKYRLTTTGLSHLCSALAPGLAQLVADLSGVRQQDSEDEPNLKLAISILNETIRARYNSRLDGRGLIIDYRNKQVEGVVGPRYQFFSNFELLDRCNEFASSLETPAVFYAGTLVGRRLSLRYLNPNRVCTVTTTDGKLEPYYSGWHFSNSEVGDCSVHAGVILYRKWSGTESLHEAGRVVHVKGGKFGPRFVHMLEVLQQKAVDELEHVGDRLRVLRETLLGLGGSPAEHEKRINTIRGKLARGKLSKVTVAKVLDSVVASGSYNADRLQINGTTYDTFSDRYTQVIRGRTAYDLYSNLTKTAKSLLPEQQERVESLAHRILMDRFKFM